MFCNSDSCDSAICRPEPRSRPLVMEAFYFLYSPFPLFTRVRGETVWKFGIALSSGCHLGVKGCEEALFGRLQRSDEDDGDPLQLFSKQFRNRNSRKFAHHST